MRKVSITITEQVGDKCFVDGVSCDYLTSDVPSAAPRCFKFCKELKFERGTGREPIVNPCQECLDATVKE